MSAKPKPDNCKQCGHPRSMHSQRPSACYSCKGGASLHMFVEVQ